MGDLVVLHGVVAHLVHTCAVFAFHSLLDYRVDTLPWVEALY